ncbi:MAG: pseudouridine synthase [Saprospiraceae bacterium]|nr:pseudouridine synthase [Saprospiraceae bacterium]
MFYFLLNKPYGMLSQFTQEAPGQRTLADLGLFISPDVYPVGRLDADSEGMLVLTNDKALNARLLNPQFAHPRTYWVQVEGLPTEEALERLRQGVEFRIEGKVHRSRPATAVLLEERPTLPDRDPPIRVRKSIPDTWLALTLAEGKNRQVRRMCAAVGFPVLRLLRVQIGGLGLGDLQPGQVRELSAADLRVLFREEV